MLRIRAISTMILGLAVLMLPGVAAAQTSRVYFATYMGLLTYGDQNFTEDSTGTGGDLQYKNAWSFGGALGLRLSQQTRVEAEINYSNTDMDRVNFDGLGSFEMAGDIRSWTGLVNAYYDFDTGWKLQPFVGAGVGVGHFNAEFDDISGFAADTSDDAYGLVYQLGGGFKYRMNPDLALTTGYRYLGSTNLEFDGYKLDYGGHEFRLGLEYDLPITGGK